jgi:hypothetical protein
MQDAKREDLPHDRTKTLAGVSVASVNIPPRGLRLWALTLGAGALAGLLSWAAGEPLREVVRPRSTAVRTREGTRTFIPPPESAAADTRNAALSFTVLGGLSGAGLGVAGGLSRKNGRAVALAGLVGLVLGAAVAGRLTILLLPAYFAFRMRTPDESLQNLFWPLIVHIGLWAPAGAAGGLAFAIGHAARRRTLAVVMGGLLGAALGTAVYEIVGALAFPMAGTPSVISSTAGTRLLARVAVTTFAAAGVALGLTMELSPGDEAPHAPAG